MPCSCIPLTFQFPGAKGPTGFRFEGTETLAQGCSNIGEHFQSEVRMHTKLGNPMPVSEIKENIEDICIMRFREKAIKDRYRALNEKIKTKLSFTCMSLTCNMSS